MIRRPRPCRRRDERGAVAVFVAVLMSLVLVGITAFAVDIGMKRAASRDMQALSDIVALDLSRLLDGRSAADVVAGNGGQQSLQAALDQSVDRNDDGTIGTGKSCRSGGDARIATTGRSCLRAYLVELLANPDADGYIYPHSGTDPISAAAGVVPDGVVVISGTTVNYIFKRGENGTTYRAAVAQRGKPWACFEMGSFAAALDLGNSAVGPLAEVLGLETQLDLIHYQHLAGGTVSLMDLAASPSIGSSDALLNPSGVTVGDLIDASIYAVQNNESNSSADSAAAVSALEAMKIAMGSQLSGKVSVTEVVGISAGEEAALGVEMNLLELLGTSLAIANGQNFLTAPFTLNLPNVGTAQVGVTAIEGPRSVCGAPNDPQKVLTQSQIKFDASFTQVTRTIAGVTVGIGPIRLGGGVGNAKGQLVEPPPMYCGQGTLADPDTYSVLVNAGLLGLGLEAPITLNGTINIWELVKTNNALLDSLLSLLGLLGLRNAVDLEVAFNNVRIDLAPGIPGTGTTTAMADLRVPHNVRKTGTPVKIAGASPTLSNIEMPNRALSGTVTVRLKTTTLLGLLPQWDVITVNLNDLSSVAGVPVALEQLLGDLRSTLNSAVVGPVNAALAALMPLLGISGSGADVFSMPRPDCGTTPKLIG